MPEILSQFSDISQTGWFAAVLCYHLVVGYWGMKFLREERDALRAALKDSREQFIEYMTKRNGSVEKELQSISKTQNITAERLSELGKLLDRVDQRGDLAFRKIMGGG